MAQVGCTHEFAYLIKKHGDDDFTGRVLEIPAVIVQADSAEKLDPKIQDATVDYLKTVHEDHEKALKGLLIPQLVTPSDGVVIRTQPFKVTC